MDCSKIEDNGWGISHRSGSWRGLRHRQLSKEGDRLAIVSPRGAWLRTRWWLAKISTGCALELVDAAGVRRRSEEKDWIVGGALRCGLMATDLAGSARVWIRTEEGTLVI